MYTSQQRDMDRLRRSSVPHDYDPMYANLSADSRADTAFGMAPSSFPVQDPSINLAGRAEKMQPMQAKPLPNKCVCGSYSMSVGRSAPGLQVAAPTQQLKTTDRCVASILLPFNSRYRSAASCSQLGAAGACLHGRHCEVT
jgi:hypothetical protein